MTYLDENPQKVKNAAYYRRQVKRLEEENKLLKDKNPCRNMCVDFCLVESLQVRVSELEELVDTPQQP